MTNELLTIDCDPLLESFGQWHNENDSLASQIHESIVALTDYQQQLDSWHSELEQQRSQLAHDHTEGGDLQQKIIELNAELSVARQKNDTMSADLLSKTEELRKLDISHTDLNTEVERLRAQAASSANDSTVLPPAADELKQMRDLLKQHTSAQTDSSAQQATSVSVSAPPARPAPGSVAAQFNRLRQQQAVGRTSKKPSS